MAAKISWTDTEGSQFHEIISVLISHILLSVANSHYNRRNILVFKFLTRMAYLQSFNCFSPYKRQHFMLIREERRDSYDKCVIQTKAVNFARVFIFNQLTLLSPTEQLNFLTTDNR